MKKIIARISLACALLASLFCYASCLGDEEVSETCYTSYDFANVGVNSSGRWEFNLDSGATVKWSGSDNDSILKNLTRVFVYFTFYYSKNQTVNGVEYVNPETCEVVEIVIDSIYSKEQLTAMKQLEPDSLFTYSSLDYNVARGYINMITTSQYANAILPTAHLYYAPEEVTNDTLAVHLVVNRHSNASYAGYVSLYNGFDLEPLAPMYSSKDSIVVAVHNEVSASPYCKKVSTKTLKRN